MAASFRRFRHHPGGGDAVQLIGAPATPASVELVQTLVGAVERYDCVTEVYLFQSAVIDKTAIAELAVGLVMDGAVSEEVIRSICDAIVADLERGSSAPPLVFQALSDEARDAVRQAVRPIYLRSI